MKNIAKKSIYSAVWATFLGLNGLTQVFANNTPSNTFWVTSANTLTGWLESEDLSEALQWYITYIMTFLYLIAVWFALWWGFNILTAWGDEEKVKKGKTILIQWALWLLVIFLAWSIVKWVLSLLAQ